MAGTPKQTTAESINSVQIKAITMQYDVLKGMSSWIDGTSTETNTYTGAEWHRASTDADGTTNLAATL